MIKNNYFSTPIYYEQKPEWVKKVDKACSPYLKQAKKLNSNIIKKNKTDYGIVHHSNDDPLYDSELQELKNYIGQQSAELLIDMGYSLNDSILHFTSFWVQEFPKDGGAKHSAHIHPNNHISGFYYLSTEGSYPIIYDPRIAKTMVDLPQRDSSQVTLASSQITWGVSPGTLIIMPAYLVHEYTQNKKGCFRFIHFNIQAINKKYSKG